MHYPYSHKILSTKSRRRGVALPPGESPFPRHKNGVCESILSPTHASAFLAVSILKNREPGIYPKHDTQTYDQIVVNNQCYDIMSTLTEDDVLDFCRWLYDHQSENVRRSIPDVHTYIYATRQKVDFHSELSVSDATLSARWLHDYFYQSATYKYYNHSFTLGKGSEKTVYLGKNIETGEYVAIGKFTHKTFKSGQLDTLRKLGSLHDPSFFKVHGILLPGQSANLPEIPFIVSQIYGKPLSDCLIYDNLNPNQYFDLALLLCEHVQSLHLLNIYLGDVKEQNFLMPLQLDRGYPTYGDFGHSLVVGSSPKSTCLHGTLSHTCPLSLLHYTTNFEINAKHYTFMDTFSTAVIIFDLLTSYNYFKARSQDIGQLFNHRSQKNLFNMHDTLKGLELKRDSGTLTITDVVRYARLFRIHLKLKLSNKNLPIILSVIRNHLNSLFEKFMLAFYKIHQNYLTSYSHSDSTYFPSTMEALTQIFTGNQNITLDRLQQALSSDQKTLTLHCPSHFDRSPFVKKEDMTSEDHGTIYHSAQETFPSTDEI